MKLVLYVLPCRRANPPCRSSTLCRFLSTDFSFFCCNLLQTSIINYTWRTLQHNYHCSHKYVSKLASESRNDHHSSDRYSSAKLCSPIKAYHSSWHNRTKYAARKLLAHEESTSNFPLCHLHKGGKFEVDSTCASSFLDAKLHSVKPQATTCLYKRVYISC